MNRIPALTAIVLALTSVAFPQSKLSTNIPHLEKQGAATQLIVDGKPFLVLGAELNNSSASSMEYLRPLWPKIAATNLTLAGFSAHIIDGALGSAPAGRRQAPWDRDPWGAS